MTDAGRSADWVEVHDAMERVASSVSTLGPEEVALADALGRTLAVAITSPIDQPPWDNSAMDGYAVRAADVMGAGEQSPTRLRVIEHIPAGGFPTKRIDPGTCSRIMTGAPIPEGADGVIRVEHTRSDGEFALIVNDLDAGKNVRVAAEDMRRGEVVLESGRLLRAAEIGLLATVGAARVPVARKPVAAILSTGDELADMNEFDEVRAGRKIANSNSYAIAAAIAATGANPLVLGIARDDADDLRRHIARAAGADLLITTAGASVGDHDMVKDVLDEIGFEIDFWRVRMRPGSPFSFGWLTLDGKRIPVFGLPGNPVSALVTFELFVRPALRKMLGRAQLYSPVIRVRCADRIPSKAGLTHFLRVVFQRAEDGMLEAALTGAQGSGLITSMAMADGLLVVPEDRDGLEQGELAWAVRLASGDDADPQIGF